MLEIESAALHEQIAAWQRDQGEPLLVDVTGRYHADLGRSTLIGDGHIIVDNLRRTGEYKPVELPKTTDPGLLERMRAEESAVQPAH